MTRPKIEIPRTSFDTIILIASILLLLGSGLLLLIYYNDLPDRLLILFNTPQKDTDGYGNKSLLWELPIILGIIVFVVIKLSKYPRILNYPTKITPENAAYQYKMASQMLRVLGLAISLSCFSLTLLSVLNGLGHYTHINSYVGPALLCFLAGIPIVYLVILLLNTYRK